MKTLQYVLLFAFLCLMFGCAQSKDSQDTYQYQCMDEDECAYFCQTMYPNSSLNRKQCYSNEIDRLNQQLNFDFKLYQ